MRVAFLNRDRNAWVGGDVIAIDRTIEALERIGIDVVCQPRKSLERCDLAHIFHVNFPWAHDNFDWVQKVGMPYVVTPIFYPIGFDIDKLKIGRNLEKAKAVFPFSVREGHEMCDWVGREIPFLPIPNGTDRTFHCEISSAAREGVCAAAARDGGDANRKGADRVAAACKHAGIPFDFITGRSIDEMPGEYRRYRVFVSASSTDRMSLTIGEALCAGCRVLATTENRGNEWYPGLVTIDPAMGPASMAEKIKDAYCADRWDWSPNEAARRITWDGVATMLAGEYRRICG